MGIFNRLLQVTALRAGIIPLEDYFTEIIVYLFSENKDILADWLQKFARITVNGDEEIRISSQVSFDPLENHEFGSRPDIVIEVTSDKTQQVVFIESKTGSIEHDDQLRRYAEILSDAYPQALRRILIFITKDFEPKDSKHIVQRLENCVEFGQIRWHSFYHFLRSYEQGFLVQETLNFMEENGMAQSNSFTPQDISAITRLKEVLGMMDEVLSGDVEVKFKALLSGTIDKNKKSQIQSGRYVQSGWITCENHLWCSIGFSPLLDPVSGYPSIAIIFELSPSCKGATRNEYLAFFKMLNNEYSWELDLHQSWAFARHAKSLREFLPEEDHIAAIQGYLLETIAQVETFKSGYPNLPWGKTVES